MDLHDVIETRIAFKTSWQVRVFPPLPARQWKFPITGQVGSGNPTCGIFS